MLTLDQNPFVWNERGNISGRVGALSLAAQDGSLITVENLSKDIEVSSGSTIIIMAEYFYLQSRTFFCATANYHIVWINCSLFLLLYKTPVFCIVISTLSVLIHVQIKEMKDISCPSGSCASIESQEHCENKASIF